MIHPSFLTLHHPVLLSFADMHPYWIYVGIFFAMVIEGGEAVLFSAVFLITRGIVDPFITFPLLYAGIVISDLCWYTSGPYITKWPVISRISRLASAFDPLIAKHPFRALSLSKFAYGLHHPMIVRFSLSKQPFQIFLNYTLILSFAWILVMSAVGFAIFASIAYVGHFVRFAEVGIALAIVGFFVFERVIGAYLESLVEKKEDDTTKK